MKKVNFKDSIGIDIGTHSIKVVHLKPHGEGWKLVGALSRSTVPDGLEYTPSDLRDDRYTPVLSTMLKDLRINPKKIKHLVTSIGGDDTSIKQIKTIFLPDDELESALFFEAKKHLPISGSDMILDYQVLSVEDRTNNMHILLVAATREHLNMHTEILNNVGFLPGIVDVEALAIANAFQLNNPIEEGVYIMLNVGAHKTNMVINGPKAKFFARDIAWGGFNLTQDIMRKKDMSFEEADAWKIEHGIKEEKSTDGGLGLSLDITEKSTQEQISLEVKRSLRFYVKEAGSSDFHKILLMGGGAKTKGLAEFIGKALNIPCEIFDPFSGIDVQSASDELDPQLALAVGLAMRAE